jgi:RHS repeat-associated protein
MVTNISLGQTSETWSYNAYGELARQTATFGGSPLVDIVYDEAGFERDALGRIVRKTETILGVTKVYEYRYDALRRLDQVKIDGVVDEEFTYDANGNRLTAYKAGQGTVTATYDDQDRLLTYGTYVFTYTGNGELETKTNTANGDEWLFEYDALGNLVSVGLPNGDFVEYLVDGRGRRVGKKKNGVLLKQWIYRDTLNPVAELDGVGNLVSVFVNGRPNVPDYVQRGGKTYRVLADHLGSPRYIVNVANSGDVPFKGNYTAFGEATGIGLDWLPFGFGGGRFDPDVGLVRFGLRDYEPATGRWIAKDPIRFTGSGGNLYSYVAGDPVNSLDLLGLQGPHGYPPGTMDCTYYDARCVQNGGRYYCEYAPEGCSKTFEDHPWSKCTRQCLQDCDAASHPSDNNYTPNYDDEGGACVGFGDEDPDNSWPWEPWSSWSNFACHAACYSVCFAAPDQPTPGAPWP